MPPNRTRSSRNSIEQEDRLLLAIQAIKNQEISSVREAARQFNVPNTSLRRRLAGHPYHAESRANSHKLTETEEESLKKWILSMDLRGAAPRPATVQEMANLLLAKRGSPPIQTVGEKWVYNFTQRYPELNAHFSRRYDYRRAKQEDPKIIKRWFDSVQCMIQEHGILSEDIYNFDETGFAMDLTETAKMITRAEYYGQSSVLQPGNREWVTAIESISASGWALPPVIIFKGKTYNKAWFDNLPGDWQFEVSPNGWSTDQIGLRWLQRHFIPATKGRTKGKYRLLILDGHGGRLTPQFDQICSENHIIPLCMPPHSSHLLQPLDIGCFALLKRAYNQFVENQMRLGVNHIDRLDFLTTYPYARAEAFKSETIQNSFAAAGLVPFNSDRVLSNLDIQLHTPTPHGSRPGSRSSAFSSEMSQNIAGLEKQASSIKAFLKRRSKGPQSPADLALNQLMKGFQLMVHGATLLAKENIELRAAIEKQKRKPARTNERMVHERDLSVQEAQEPFEPIHSIQSLPAQSIAQPARRRLPTCGKCRGIGHKANACPLK